MATVEERLETLEKRVERYRKVTTVLAVLLVAGVTMGQTAKDPFFDSVTCRSLWVKNMDGTTTALIATTHPAGDGIAVPKQRNLPPSAP